MKNKLLLLILAFAVSVTLAACGGTPSDDAVSEDGDGTVADDALDDAVDEPLDGEETESDRAYVDGKGSIIIGYTVYEPMNFTDSEGNFTGFDTELAEIVCERLGLAPEFVEIDWNTKEIELNAKNIDCIWNGMTITDERKENMEVTIPYARNAQVVVMKADAEYTDVSSLAGKAVCAEAGSAGESAVNEFLTDVTFISKEVQTACLMEVAAGTADAAVLDLTLANAMIGEGTDYADLVIKDRLSAEDYGVAFRKGSDLCGEVNAIFEELVNDGTMGELAQKYGLDLS